MVINVLLATHGTCPNVFSSLGEVSPPRGVRVAMEMKAEAERKKRAQVLESEGYEVLLIFQLVRFISQYIYRSLIF